MNDDNVKDDPATVTVDPDKIGHDAGEIKPDIGDVKHDILRRLLPVILFIAALGLRLAGIGWGLPNDLHNQSYHPDEQVIWAYSQQIEPAKGKFTPGFYNYGTMYLTVLRVASDVVAGYGAAPKQGDSQSIWRYMGACHLAGRWISALAGATAVVFVFLILRRFTNEFGAATGALLLAFAPSFLVHSRFQTVDVFATMLLAASLYCSLRVLDASREGSAALLKRRTPEAFAVWSAVFAGLSAGTKYTGALALLPLVVALYLRLKSEGSGGVARTAFGAFAAFFAALVIATPGVLLETDKFLRDFKYEMLHTSTGHGLVFEGLGSGFLVHVGNLVQGMGPLGALIGAAGLVWAAWRREKWALALLAFALPYYVLIGRAEVLFVRYTFPLIVVLAIAFGWALGEAHRLKGKHVATAVGGILALGMSLYIGMGFTAWMVQEEPRDKLAKEFKERGESVGIGTDPWFYTPPLIPDSAIMRGQLALQVEEMRAAQPPLLRYLPEDPAQRQDWDVRLLTEMKPHYVVMSNLELAHVVRLSDTSGKYPQVDAFKVFQAELERSYEPLGQATTGSIKERYRAAMLLVEDMAYTRPVYWIWKRKP